MLNANFHDKSVKMKKS